MTALNKKTQGRPPAAQAAGWLEAFAWLRLVFEGVSRKCRRTQSAASLRIEQRLPLGSKKALLLVCCAGERFLLSENAEETRLIGRMGRMGRKGATLAGRPRARRAGLRP